MLITQLNNLITNNTLTEYSVCKILNYALTSVNNNGKERYLALHIYIKLYKQFNSRVYILFNRRIMLVLDIEVLVPGSKVGCKIGNPIKTDGKSEPECVTTSNTSTATSCQTSNRLVIFLFCVNYIQSSFWMYI